MYSCSVTYSSLLVFNLLIDEEARDSSKAGQIGIQVKSQAVKGIT